MLILRVVRNISSNIFIFNDRSNFLFRLELAGLAEQEFGLDSGAMFNDLHAPSVPVQPIDAGATAAAASRVCD